MAALRRRAGVPLLVLIGLLCVPVPAGGAVMQEIYTVECSARGCPRYPPQPPGDVDPPYEQWDYWQCGESRAIPHTDPQYSQKFTDFWDYGLDYMGPGTFTLPKFDDQGGTRELVRVILTIEGDIWGGSHNMRNNTPDPGTGWVRIQPEVYVVSLSRECSDLQEAFTPDVRVDGPLPPLGGQLGAPVVGGNWFDDQTDLKAAGPPYGGSDDLSVFLAKPGDDVITFGYISDVRTSEQHSVSPVTTWSDPPGFLFNAQVTYEWVPEPTSLALLGLAAPALLRRRRARSV